MALDGAFVRFLTNELKNELCTARVSQIHQPNKDELLLSLRTLRGGKKLLISARANSPRVSFTENAPENPASPPMLCMLLRKKLSGAKISDVRQPDLERIIFIDFDAVNELGDSVKYTLACEIMGKYSNVIFIDENETVIEALKRIDAGMTTGRIVLPGMKYTLPPAQNKLSVLSNSPEAIVSAITRSEEKLGKAILNTVLGIAPLISREIEYRITNGEAMYADSLDSQHLNRLKYYIGKLADDIINVNGKPCCIYDESGKPKDMSFTEIRQYGSFYTVKTSDSFSSLLDSFYSERDKTERMRARSQDLLRLLTNASERCARKINTQQAELEQCADREHLKICGDLIQANLYRIEKGSPFVELENFYDESMSKLRIRLDPSKSPSQNAQKYYKEYRKAKTAEIMLTEQLTLAKRELEYLDNVFDSLSRAETERELSEIRSELVLTGYIKAPKAKGKGKEQKPLPPLEFKTTDGLTVLVGRNNRQNDQLTLKTAAKNDIWFHTKDIPGSHTILVTNGQEPSEEAVRQAAAIAAYHSKAREGSQVPVDYTRVRNVSKPQGARPGTVIFVKNRTIYVKPEVVVS